MKKTILLWMLAIGTVARLAAQGTVIFESSAQTGTITFNTATGPAAGSVLAYEGGAQGFGTTWQVALLWSATLSTSQPLSAFTQAVVYNVGPSDPGHDQGFFTDGTAITIPFGSGGGDATFVVEAWTGNYANFAAAQAGGAGNGLSAEFVNAMGNPNLPTPTPPVNTTGFNGDIIVFADVMIGPEPGTITLGGLGVVVLWLFRRGK